MPLQDKAFKYIAVFEPFILFSKLTFNNVCVKKKNL